MTNLNDKPEPGVVTPPNKSRRRVALAMALLGAMAAGAGATAVAQRSHPVTLVALTPAPITAMKDRSAVAVKGEVAEIFGNKFVIQDDAGRALVETGRQGERGGLVVRAETVIVQGRFEHGFIHALAIQHADGHNDLVGPPGPPPPPRSTAALEPNAAPDPNAASASPDGLSPAKPAGR